MKFFNKLFFLSMQLIEKSKNAIAKIKAKFDLILKDKNIKKIPINLWYKVLLLKRLYPNIAK